MRVMTPSIPVAAPSPFAVWQEYRRSRDARLRDRLVFTLAPLVRHAGGTAADAQTGLCALMVAVEEYEPSRHGSLEAFAWGVVRASLSA